MSKRKPRGAAIEPRDILEAFKSAQKPLGLPEILSRLGLPKREKEHLRNLLAGLVTEARLVNIGQGYGLPGKMKMVPGRLEVQRSGVGFVIPEDRRRKDIFVHPSNFGGAWHGDRVQVVVTREGERPEGRIARVVERTLELLTVRARSRLSAELWLCEPTSPKFQFSVAVEAAKGGAGLGEFVENEVMVVKVGEEIDRNVWEATLVERLGPETGVGVQERLVKVSAGVPMVFPAAVLEEAEALPQAPAEADFHFRRDLRHLDFVTIDGARARDFDDAIYVEERPGGHTLWVAIADVAHYVTTASALDKEALERGNSYYFPQSVEPMFPERLSNGLCSLNPHVPRLTMVAEIDLDSQGLPGRTDFYAAVIESKARLVYEQVAAVLIDKDEAEREKITPVLPMLERAEVLARRIGARRRERGSLDFDLPEPEIHFNLQGEAVDIRPRVRTFAHQLIEEFMIAANEAVARYLTERGAGLLYRVHPSPDTDKIRNLFQLLGGTELGPMLPKEASPKGLQGLLQAAEGTSLAYLVGRLTLRTMMQARYLPDNDGHFGLASECYCHFTSPIRRYADLIVHRALKHELGLEVGGPGGRPYGEKKLRDISDHVSARERVAMDAEREMLKRSTILILQDKVGQEFTGVVSSLLDFGLFVELKEVMAEGMVRLSTLRDDYYTFFPEKQLLLGQRTGRAFRLGQTVSVVLTDVNLSRLEVNLELADGPESGGDTGGGAGGDGVTSPRRPRTGKAGLAKAGRSGSGRKPARGGGRTSGKPKGR